MTDDRVLTVESYLRPDSVPPDVLKLFAESELASLEFGVTWLQNLVDTVYPIDQGVRIQVLRVNGQAMAGLPIRLVRKGSCTRIESLGNFYTALFAPALHPAAQAADLAHLLRQICDATRSIDSMWFSPMDPDSGAYEKMFLALKMAGMFPFRFFCFGNWFWTVNADWSSYLLSRPGALRNTIKRQAKKFAANGGRLEIVKEGEAVENALQAYQKVYSASWKVAEPFPDFIPGLIRSSASRQRLRLGVAWLQDEPIAAQIWLVSNNKAYIYKLAYDEQYQSHASGTLLTAALMQHVLEHNNVREVDYLIGDDVYKKTWVDARRERWGIVAYNPRTIFGLGGLFKELGGRTVKALKTRINCLRKRQQPT